VFSISRSKFRFLPPKPAKPVKEKPKRQKLKNDPALVAKARELNGRWLELINNDPTALPSTGKYQASRSLEDGRAQSVPLLAA
jgi:hypothetical protein